MFITRDFDILFLVCNGYLVIRVGQLWHTTLRIVMNTSIHMILETLSFSFGMAKEILKDNRVFIWKSKVFYVLLPKRRRTIPNKGKFKRRNKRASSMASDSFVTF